MIRSLFRFFGHCDFLRFGLRDRVLRFFHNPDTASSEEFMIPFYGGRYRGNLNSYIDWNVYYYGAYCPEELRLIEDFLLSRPDPVFVDIGANAGNHTLFAALKCKHVISFEPYEPLVKSLKTKQQDNGLSNLEICPFGLGDNNSIQPYNPPAAANRGVGSFAAGTSSNSTLMLEIKKGDDVFESRAIGKIDMIKMDIEGFEPLALQGLRQTLKKHRPVVFFEWTKPSIQLCKGASPPDLFPENYRFYQFTSETVVLKFFRHRSYQLRVVAGEWPEGNMLAVPRECAESLKNQRPLFAAARQLLRAEQDGS